MQNLTQAKKVAFLLANDYEDSEMMNPYDEMVKNGHEAVIISLKSNEELKGKKGTITYTSHLGIEEANADEPAFIRETIDKLGVNAW